MQTPGMWRHTLTFFPQFLAALKERTEPDSTVTVIGASDGRLVVPLAGYRVVAIEATLSPSTAARSNSRVAGPVTRWE
ncbi:hypothetical protein [Streptomyces sp. NPDC088725]|uniref:hypothetical protein n=1 Tax=Streptomyces sp. NPDC088725 TaxID=3365873 RepID=UPI003814627D